MLRVDTLIHLTLRTQLALQPVGQIGAAKINLCARTDGIALMAKAGKAFHPRLRDIMSKEHRTQSNLTSSKLSLRLVRRYLMITVILESFRSSKVLHDQVTGSGWRGNYSLISDHDGLAVPKQFSMMRALV